MAVAPALYSAHKATALEEVARLPLHRRAEAYANVCDFILHKQSPVDPFDEIPGQGFDVSYEEIVALCELIRLIDVDAISYGYIQSVADTMTTRRRRDRYTQQHKLDIARRLDDVLRQIFPSARHITHDGYKIASQAQVARIRQVSAADWEQLAQAARGIPNAADKAFVLCAVATAMPPRDAPIRKTLFDEC